MGWSPGQVDETTYWQFQAALVGWQKANAPPEGPKAPTPEEFEAHKAAAGMVH